MIPFERNPGEPRRPRHASDWRRELGRAPADPKAAASQKPRAPGEPEAASPARAGTSGTAAPNGAAAARRRSARAGWLIGPALLFAVGAAIRLVMRGPDELFGLCFAVLLGLGVLWILTCALLPAKAERRCPECGREALQRLDRNTTRGLVCTACGWRDETASSFLLAEEEGPLEDIVLRERGGRRRW